MPRERPPEEDPAFHRALWSRARWLRMQLGGGWEDGAHAAAESEYLRLDAMPIPAEEKVRRLAEYLSTRADPDQVARELERFARVTRRFPATGPTSVRRLRLTLPAEQ